MLHRILSFAWVVIGISSFAMAIWFSYDVFQAYTYQAWNIEYYAYGMGITLILAILAFGLGLLSVPMCIAEYQRYQDARLDIRVVSQL